MKPSAEQRGADGTWIKNRQPRINIFAQSPVSLLGNLEGQGPAATR
jgi:hypothetical protein